MLELSRYQAGRIQLHAVRVDIKTVVNSVIRKLQDLGAAQKFEVDIQPDVIYMDADLLRIERVFHNLLENAVKYSPRESRIKVTCRVEKGYLEAEVSDEGPGISEEEQRDLFQPFQRMGLVVSKRLVEAHGG
jgi:two-component system sensor histidine kinase KdpD